MMAGNTLIQDRGSREQIIFQPENKLFMPTETFEGSPGSFFRKKSSRDTSAQVRTFKSPVYLKDGSRLSGVADNPEQNPFYGFDKSGQEFSQRREYINPQDITKSRDSDRTANQIRNELESGQKLFMPASEAGASKGKVAEAAKLWNEKGTDSPYFKKWFGKSKVVDQNGEPLVVYHGTDKQFTSFDPEKSIGGQNWFTSDKSAIEAGEVGAQGKGIIMETYLNIEKPASWAEYDKFTIDELIGRGYDGLILPESDGTATYVTYSPEQIKSATGNRGTFDAGERNILFMPSDSNYLKAVKQGDMQAAQQMVDQKAKENGYTRKYHHGTSAESKENILRKGINQMKSEKGYFGRGFYAADDLNLARENYAEFSGDESGGAIVSFVIPDSAKILDLKTSQDFETYKNLRYRGRPVESLISLDNFNEIMVDLGIDGLKDESFGGIVIYNEKLVKSADPINYDSKGNPIPLSKRFDSSKDSILYMPSDRKAPTRQPANRITRQAPAMPGNRFMVPAASAGAKLSERFR
jgi:hypothetical protein